MPSSSTGMAPSALLLPWGLTEGGWGLRAGGPLLAAELNPWG